MCRNVAVVILAVVSLGTPPACAAGLSRVAPASFTVDELADMMDGTIQRIEPIVVVYSASRRPTGSSVSGFKALVLSGREPGASGRQFREEIYAFENMPSPQRTLVVFDGTVSRAYRPANNTGTIQTGLNVGLLSSNSIDNFYRQILGQYLPDAMRSKAQLFSPATILFSGEKAALLELQPRQNGGPNQIRYLIKLDHTHGSLPSSIRREMRKEGEDEWHGVVEYRVEWWQTLKEGVPFPERCSIVNLAAELTPPVRVHVLYAQFPRNVEEVINELTFPVGCSYMNLDTGESSLVRILPASGFGSSPAATNSRSLFPIALGISLNEARQMFAEIPW